MKNSSSAVTRWFAASIAACLLWTAGCQAPAPDPALHVTGRVQAASQDRVISAMNAVFSDHGYQGGQTGGSLSTYQVTADGSTYLATGNSGTDHMVTVRVVAALTPAGSGAWDISLTPALLSIDGSSVPADQAGPKLQTQPFKKILVDIQSQIAP